MRNLRWIFILIILIFSLAVGCGKSVPPSTETNSTISTSSNSTTSVVAEDLSKLSSSDFEKTTYRTLQTMKTMYVVLMQSSGDLYKSGDISEESKEKIIALGNIYYGSYMILVSAFEKYHLVQNEESKTALLIQLYKTIKDYNTILEYFNNVTSGIKGVQQWTKI